MMCVFGKKKMKRPASASSRKPTRFSAFPEEPLPIRSNQKIFNTRETHLLADTGGG